MRKMKFLILGNINLTISNFRFLSELSVNEKLDSTYPFFFKCIFHELNFLLNKYG